MTDVIPAPRAAQGAAAPDVFRFGADTTVWAAPGTDTTARWLRAVLGPALGLPLPPAAGEDAPGVLRLRLDDTLEPEGYRLTVTGRDAEICGGDAAGVFWGAQTLRQLLGPDAFRRAPVRPEAVRAVPAQVVEDAPRFRWRGLLLDVARHFLPKDGVLRYLDLMAAHKLNVLHLHLTDDQGWRIEILRYPHLTEIASWRARSRFGHRASPLWEEKPHGGYYTQDDIREIVAYAAERHITVVPEIDVPGHSQAAIAAYPELGNTDVVDTAALTVWDDWGISRNVLAPTDTTLRFYENVLEEVLDLFPAHAGRFSAFVHLGGDECPKEQWRASPAAQARIAELGLSGEEELQAWFIGHFDTWLAARGRRLIGWDEILEGVRTAGGTGPDGGPGAATGLTPGAAVSSWRGYAGGIAAARAGHDVVMCPEQHVYLDHRQDTGADEPVPIGYVRTLEDVYRFEPVPDGLDAGQARHVLGTQANLWTEVTEDAARLDYQAFPRLAAFAEVAWSALPAPERRDFAGFERRMRTHYRRLDGLGVAYRPPTGPLPWQRRPGVPGRPVEGTPPAR
ncbi:beta-N-acetylhexosaminidase [Streptomyces thermodiastaticus]|uniref:beta-N-acetylhexosaminidase n=1 Tax=Streptomyces thermodiastaticus TaxID=44061 RepID=UPI0016780EB3|nr:beta-N-acetylhexosaminidase [Streptomyces thermodiastaticus]MCE7552281.1 beta-N-acetylhexosaminidase [Streptomyces thermodiastaticus]GHF90692.1 beta-N-acetylhexosaminidase [Streptomyces thermodiastaticus]